MATAENLDHFCHLGFSISNGHVDYASFIVPSQRRSHSELRQHSRASILADLSHGKLADICYPRRRNLALLAAVRIHPAWEFFFHGVADVFPSNRVGAIFGVDVLATLFCVFGWLSGPGYNSDPRDRAHFEPNGRTSVVTAVVIWGYSIAVTIVIAIVYFLMNRISWLDNLGRKSRSRSDTNVENIIASLVCLTFYSLVEACLHNLQSKIAIQHEADAKTGHERFFIAPKATDAEMDE